MAIPDPATCKSSLRTEMRRLARAQRACSVTLCTRIREHLESHPEISTVAVYAALPDEPDLSALVAGMPALRWVFPRVTPNGLIFHHVADPATQLAPGAFKIPEPLAHLPPVPPADIDAFLCPGLAFDSRGGRLGRGKGYYDRILEHARPDAHRIGTCYPFQCVEDTFAEPHDIPMTLVITA